MNSAKRIGVLVAIVVSAVAVYWLSNRPHIRLGAVGPLQTSCRKVPAFAAGAGITTPAFDTSQKDRTGLVMYNVQHPEKAYQLPSWTSGGNLGPQAIDDSGNIYVAPVPNINTLLNPPNKQNTIYKVDSATGVMSEFYSLQRVPTPGQTNPYGILSLAFDCETHVLYASTISGSTATVTKGAIIAIDTGSQASPDKREISRITGIDALSVGLFRDAKGAELYYGMANHSRVWRVGLTSKGAFVGSPAQVFSYDQFDELKPRKLDFTDAQTLQVHTTEFRYNLIASTEFRQEIITYKYAAEHNSWERVQTPKP